MKNVLNVLKRVLVILLGILAVLFIITGIFVLVTFFRFKMALDACAAQNSVRAELQENRIELNMDDYCVIPSGLTAVEGTWGTYAIDGISVDDIVYMQDLWSTHILLRRDSKIKNPLFDLECKAFSVNGVKADIKYTESIRAALKGPQVSGVISGESVGYSIYLNSECGLLFAGEIIRVEATEENERAYFIEGFGGYNKYLLEDSDGLYTWLDENVFTESEENGDGTDEEILTAA